MKNIKIWRMYAHSTNSPSQNWVDMVFSFKDLLSLSLYPLSLSTALLHSFSLMLCPASLMTTSVTNSSLMPGHDCSTSSKAFFSSSMASPCPEPTGVSWRSLSYKNSTWIVFNPWHRHGKSLEWIRVLHTRMSIFRHWLVCLKIFRFKT